MAEVNTRRVAQIGTTINSAKEILLRLYFSMQDIRPSDSECSGTHTQEDSVNPLEVAGETGRRGSEPDLVSDYGTLSITELSSSGQNSVRDGKDYTNFAPSNVMHNLPTISW